MARLARLGLSDEEVERVAGQLSQILEAMTVVDALDTSQIPPTAQVLPIRSVMREDEPAPSLPVVDVLRNAPRREGDFLKVPPVLD